MILEPKTVLILRCDRCNTPHLDSEYEVPCRWDSREQIEEAFKSDPGDGWQKVGDQFLCEPCVPVGAVPLSAIDEAVVRRERAGYADAPASPELPDYITLDPEQGSCADRHGAHWHCPAHRHTGTWIGQDDNVACARAEAVKHLNELHPGWDAPAAPQGVDAPVESTP